MCFCYLEEVLLGTRTGTCAGGKDGVQSGLGTACGAADRPLADHFPMALQAHWPVPWQLLPGGQSARFPVLCALVRLCS